MNTRLNGGIRAGPPLSLPQKLRFRRCDAAEAGSLPPPASPVYLSTADASDHVLLPENMKRDKEEQNLDFDWRNERWILIGARPC